MRSWIPIALATFIVSALACAGRGRSTAAPLPERAGPAICSDVWPELPRPDGGVSAFAPAVQAEVAPTGASPPDAGTP